MATLFSEYWPYLSLPLLYVAIVLWVYRPKAKRRYQADGNIPFDGEGNEGEKGRGGR